MNNTLILIPNNDFKNEIDHALRNVQIKYKKKSYYDTSPTKITRQIQKLEGEQIAQQKRREEKNCYVDGGRKCIRKGCVGLCLIQKKGNGKKRDYVACPVKGCGMSFCRVSMMYISYLYHVCGAKRISNYI